MQTGFTQPTSASGNNDPGCALVHPVASESDNLDLLDDATVIGSPPTPSDTTPSLFDAVFTTDDEVMIAVGHQSDQDLNDEEYLSVYDVDEIPSDHRAFARVSITRLS